ncbi:helix-turn-helix domain-containing protein [Anaerosacchariphilus polymeriproducens]|uniref:AraC family transcriptional regulator n=1 Tax=Anaerosacchariphilus polymeriproducens TaxID=1812858 RepID=A0A371AYM6_9FIRM|nr:AraC family transcriptional regulator [Anaerosacchariphilus polymeriproducens]RDU24602.1 AraC family transcriptional regulator [Anaerosacchariphilus polymeriproducens]
MLSTINTILLNNERKETVKRGTPGFPCNAYIGDIHNYIVGEISLHWHSELEIFVLDEGMVQIIFADHSYVLRPGEGYFVNADVLHGIICNTDQPCRYRSVVFDQSVISGCTGSVFDKKYVNPFVKRGASSWVLNLRDTGSAAVISLFNVAFYACEMEPEGYEFTVRDAMSKIIMLLNGHKEEKAVRVETMQEQRLKQMLNWIDEHYMDKVTVRLIADAAGVCERECQRTFAKVIKDTPIRYLMRRRIAIAADMLKSSNASNSEICALCGFESQSYFTKQFRLIMGVTPKQYQRNIRTNMLKLDRYNNK